MSETSINWRELDLNEYEDRVLLSRVIALRLGWEFMPTSDGYLRVFEPNHVPHIKYPKAIEPYEPNIWGLVEAFTNLPDWLGDLNAAIQLKHEGWSLSLFYLGGEGEIWTVHYLSDKNVKSEPVWDTNPALAICRAWLQTFEIL